MCIAGYFINVSLNSLCFYLVLEVWRTAALEAAMRVSEPKQYMESGFEQWQNIENVLLEGSNHAKF